MPTRTATRQDHHWKRSTPTTSKRSAAQLRDETQTIRPPAMRTRTLPPSEPIGVDLRRRNRADHADRLVHLASQLPANDRALVEAVYLHGRSAVEIAQLTSLPVRRVRKRIRQLVLRISSARYLYVLRQRDTWTRTRRRVADAIVVQGLSMRKAAATLGLTYHTVRGHAGAIKAMFEADQGSAW